MKLLLVTADTGCEDLLPGLTLLPHTMETISPELAPLIHPGIHDAVLVDARTELVRARKLCRLLSRKGGRRRPIIAVVDEDGLASISRDWAIDEIILPCAKPVEIDARLLLLRPHNTADPTENVLVLGDLTIDEVNYTARLRCQPLELNFYEFQLLKHLVHCAGRTVTHHELFHAVWGCGSITGPHVVDVYLRRLNAKLGTEHSRIIGTVYNS